MNPVLLPTSLVGSYPQPEWLIDRKKLADRFPPRTRARELWRVSPEFLGEAQVRDLQFLRANTDRMIKMYLQRDVAFGKMKALVAGARLVREKPNSLLT